MLGSGRRRTSFILIIATCSSNSVFPKKKGCWKGRPFLLNMSVTAASGGGGPASSQEKEEDQLHLRPRRTSFTFGRGRRRRTSFILGRGSFTLGSSRLKLAASGSSQNVREKERRPVVAAAGYTTTRENAAFNQLSSSVS